MHTNFAFLIAGAVLFAATVTVKGHHAFGAEFDPDAPIRRDGVGGMAESRDAGPCNQLGPQSGRNDVAGSTPRARLAGM